MAEFPAHIPSIPSLRLAPLETAVTTKMVMITKRIQPAATLYLPQKLVMLAFDGEVLVHLHVWRSPEHQTYDEADTNLSYDFVFALQSLFVALENLDEVIHSTEETKPYGSDDHQDQIDVAQSAEQQYRYEDGQDDDDATHGWDTDLLYAEWVDAGIALGLGNLLALEVLDELLAKPCRDDE